MSADLEQRLSEHLHAHPLGDDAPGLAVRSVRRAQAIRRRRVAGVVGVLLLVLVLPWTAGLLRSPRADAPPATALPSPSPSPGLASPRGARVVILDPVGRQLRGESAVPTLRDGFYWPVVGPRVPLPEGLVGTVTTYGGEPAWLTRSGAGLVLNLAGAVPLPTDGEEVTGVEPGPAGSVMVRTDDGPVLWTRASGFVTPSAPSLRTRAVAATADARWAVRDGRVVRLSAGDVADVGNDRRLDARWKRVLRGDPRSDRVVVADGDGCQAVLDGATAEPVYQSCDVQLSAFSADGALGAGRNVSTGLLAVVDLASGRLLLALDPEGNPVGPRMVFDDAGVLNLRVGDADVTFAFLVCDLSGDCWFTSPPYVEPIDFVLPNRP
jgi:hypothetical protein